MSPGRTSDHCFAGSIPPRPRDAPKSGRQAGHLAKPQAIKDSGESANSLGKKAGVEQSTITRFLNGAEMRTENIDKLADYFGLKLCREKKTKG